MARRTHFVLHHSLACRPIIRKQPVSRLKSQPKQELQRHKSIPTQSRTTVLGITLQTASAHLKKLCQPTCQKGGCTVCRKNPASPPSGAATGRALVTCGNCHLTERRHSATGGGASGVKKNPRQHGTSAPYSCHPTVPSNSSIAMNQTRRPQKS